MPNLARITSPVAAVLGLLGFLLGCNDYVFDRKAPGGSKEQTIHVPAPRPAPADILFVVDNSGSMADDQDALARSFDAFIDTIAGSPGADYQIAIVTTDVVSAGNEKAGLQTFVYSPTFPFKLTGGNRDDCRETTIPHGCRRGPIIKSTMPRQEQIDIFSQSVRVGSCGSGDEQALKAMSQALAAPCNADFIRPNANLVVVIVSDEEDFEIDPRNRQGATPIATYVSELVQLKGSAAKIRVATVVGAVGGAPARCRIGADGAPAMCGSLCSQRDLVSSGDLDYWDSCYWCSFYNHPECCSAIGGSRYIELAKAMEVEITRAVPSIESSGCMPAPGARAACLIDSICQREFKETLIRIARDLVIDLEYVLDPPAVYPPGVVVRAGGRTLTYCPNADAPPSCSFQQPPARASCDFDVIVDEGCLGRRLVIHGPNAPGANEPVEVYFVTEVTRE